MATGAKAYKVFECVGAAFAAMYAMVGAYAVS